MQNPAPISTCVFLCSLGYLFVGCKSEDAPTPGNTGGAGGVEEDGSAMGGAAGSAGVAEGLDAAAYDSTMSFFVTSRGGPKGGDFRQSEMATDGLAGADAFCKELAGAVRPELGDKTWRAYLSTSTVDARSRIGTGPWYSAQMIIVAETVEQLHDEGGVMNNLVVGDYLNVRDEWGEEVPADRHDILTGSTAAGLRDPDGKHCSDWTSTMGEAMAGHSDRKGGDTTSWNAAHSVGCAPPPMMGTDPDNRVEGTVTSGGGRGSIFCFAVR
jgi:hypothetical protein